MPFYRILRMGCGVSKIDANGVATPNRSILPNFHSRRRQSTKSIPSKKEPLLLMPEPIDRPSISAPKCDDNLSCVTSEGSKKEEDEKRIAKIRTIVEEAEKNDEKGRLHENEGEEVEEDDNDDDQRAINKVRVDEEDGGDFPSSPSFRVYFTDKDAESRKINDGNYNKVGLKDVTPAAATISSTKESESVGKEEKKEIRKKSFRNVLPRNLLNGRSSSNSSTRSSHHHKVAS
ncbi:nuclear polyadenylated RNA-binding protein 3-like [Lycium barbarum]|uniref:nuclear polyadenylated RNA-binding protein 3-like n=1 Tax=Lycium barbarum TaxID=112863 RepID=UPI00293E90CD|nr:nuclear polyadenylated RNA-binding protein 3-like [Lycium barbarum]